jgi:23S rRNA (adenine-N6)-dimethyltransferase
VLDLGAGDGSLTWPMLARGARVLAVELHPSRLDDLRRGQSALEAGAGAVGALTIVARDLRDLWMPGRPFRVVSSPPYAMTAAIIRTLMTSDRMRSADLVLQRGAALGFHERGLKGPHARRYRTELGLRVPRHAFTNRPPGDSLVLQIRHR